MSAPPVQHRLIADGDDPPVLVKEARGPEAVGRLGAEAAVLRALAHPGVVHLVDMEVDGEVARLSVGWVGPHTLATVTGLPAADAAAIVAGVADTVADVHRTGLHHGRITPDHVLLGAHGRPVLTGFADARALAGPADVRADTAALGALLTAVVAPAATSGPIPERRRGRRGDDGLRATLLTLADRAQDGPADDDLDPGELAARIRRTLGGAPRPPHRAPTGRRTTGRTGAGRPARRGVAPTRVALVAALGTAVAVTVGAAAWLRPDDRAETRATATTPTTTAPPTTGDDERDPDRDGATARPEPVAPTTVPPCPPTAGPTVADVDGDGCVEDVAVDGERVTVDGATWVIGRPGDTVVVGDWDCDGTATAASLRPSSGEVFVFRRWSGSEEDLTVGPVATLADARSLRAVVTGDGCHDLVAVDATGTATVVEAAA